MALPFLALLASLSLAAGEERSPRTIAGFALKDTAGKVVSLADFAERKAVVVVFLGTECPLNNAFLPRLAELHRTYSAQGVAFLGINSNSQDTVEEIAEHRRKFVIPFPVLHDPGNVVADRFEAQRTPEAFLLDSGRAIRYRGRIDDQYGIDFQRPAPTRRDLAAALEELLAGKKVSVSRTEVAGCRIGRVAKTRGEGPVTFTRDISRLLQKHCQECHRPGQVAPMPLLTYDDVVSWSAMIREVVAEKRMPPWYADPRHGKFRNDRSLPTKDLERLLAWLDGGMPRGKKEDLPEPRKFSSGWTIGTPDVVLTMPREFEVPAEKPPRGVPYQHFSVPTDFGEDKWVVRAEAIPGAPEVVHHILVFIVPPGKRFFPGSPDTPVLAGMAPGEQALMLPEGYAKALPKGSRLVFQLHYTPNGKKQVDRSRLGLIFAKKPPAKKVVTLPIYQTFFRIPPGAKNHEVATAHVFRKDGWAIGYMPHMHLRGKDFTFRAEFPDGKQRTLLSVPRYNFNWQGVYRPETADFLPAGTKLHCVAHFDNSADNPNNPDPTRPVFWGDQTWEEMMVGWVDWAVPND